MKIAIIGYGGMGGYHAEFAASVCGGGRRAHRSRASTISTPARAELARKNGIRALCVRGRDSGRTRKSPPS